MQRDLSEKLQQIGAYEEIVSIPLISDFDEKGNDVIIQPTKENFRTVLDLLANREVEPQRVRNIPRQIADKIRQARPEDLVLISFSSHGYADQEGTFYVFPYDLGQTSERTVSRALLNRSISSQELSLWLRDVDAGELVMIVDACHSAAAVQGAGFKPGPMGSRGLGQLAYDKGMRILAATQADNVAVGSGQLSHGLLTYALTRDGIEEGKADLVPQDQRITIAEWLRYGKERVPTLYQEKVAQNGTGKTQQPVLFDFGRQRRDVVLVERH